MFSFRPEISEFSLFVLKIIVKTIHTKNKNTHMWSQVDKKELPLPEIVVQRCHHINSGYCYVNSAYYTVVMEMAKNHCCLGRTTGWLTCGLEVITAVPYAFSSSRLWSQSFVIALGSLWPFVNNKKRVKVPFFTWRRLWFTCVAAISFRRIPAPTPGKKQSCS